MTPEYVGIQVYLVKQTRKLSQVNDSRVCWDTGIAGKTNKEIASGE